MPIRAHMIALIILVTLSLEATGAPTQDQPRPMICSLHIVRISTVDDLLTGSGKFCPDMRVVQTLGWDGIPFVIAALRRHVPHNWGTLIESMTGEPFDELHNPGADPIALTRSVVAMAEDRIPHFWERVAEAEKITLNAERYIFRRVADRVWPNLQADGFRFVGPMDTRFNCVAWALGHTYPYWWPRISHGPPYSYWPPDIPHEATMPAFRALFEQHGYSECEWPSGTAEAVAIYGRMENGSMVPKHVARALPTGGWTSKMGVNWGIIEHDTLEALNSDVWGEVVMTMCR